MATLPQSYLKHLPAKSTRPACPCWTSNLTTRPSYRESVDWATCHGICALSAMVCHRKSRIRCLQVCRKETNSCSPAEYHCQRWRQANYQGCCHTGPGTYLPTSTLASLSNLGFESFLDCLARCCCRREGQPFLRPQAGLIQASVCTCRHVDSTVTLSVVQAKNDCARKPFCKLASTSRRFR